ncbi:MAG TPA: magnesium and cobalt transport protein CorA [Blastocatellia bacterium]|nr:magnesium and cobalt transport protein CorA [Blastocatellia bacterium]
MEIFVYKRGADSIEEGYEKKDLPELLADKRNVVWVDLLGEKPEQIEETKDVLANIFHFHPLTIEDCIETRNQPKIEAFSNYVYFILHGIISDQTHPSNFVTKELDCFLGDNFVVTFHLERFRSIKTVKQHIRSNTFIAERGSGYVLHQVLDYIIDLYLPVVDDFDKVINNLEDRIFEMCTSDNVILEEIVDLRRSVVRLRRISVRQLEVLRRISHGEFPQFPEHLLPFYRDIHDHLVRISDLAESYRDLVIGLFDIHFAVVASRTNDVMKTLAVVSAIILPLSLIAGIYGMNFRHMPELETPYGYYFILAGMFFITGSLLYYFWRRRWIFQRDEVVLKRRVGENGTDENRSNSQA